MPLYCDTNKFAAVCAGEATMTRIEREIVELAQELAPMIGAIKDEGEITLKVQHGWVSSIGTFVRSFRRKRQSSA